MKKLLLLCCALAVLPTQSLLSKKTSSRTEKRKRSKEEIAMILDHIGEIISSCADLVQAKDSDNVGRSLGDMVNGLTKIIATAIKKGKIIEDHVQTPEFKEEVAKLIIKRTRLLEPADGND